MLLVVQVVVLANVGQRAADDISDGWDVLRWHKSGAKVHEWTWIQNGTDESLRVVRLEGVSEEIAAAQFGDCGEVFLLFVRAEVGDGFPELLYRNNFFAELVLWSWRGLSIPVDELADGGLSWMPSLG